MAKGVATGSHEIIRAGSAKGFDTPGMMPGWLKAVVVLGAIVAIIIAVSYLRGGTGAGGGGVRNCILSVMGNPPDCSDSDGTLKATYANGKYVGVCKGVNNDGNCLT